MRVLGSAVLIFQAIILGLAIPVAIVIGGQPPLTAGIVGAGLIVLCVAATGVITRPLGWVLGTLVQVGTILAGLVVPGLLVLGLIFAALWGTALVLGRRVDAAKASRASMATEAPEPEPPA
jgi:hypothetical protein